jgi:hypothetical protein
MLASKQYFSDGFPKDPHEVLDFIDESIFQDYLGPKEEWLEWLSLASQENIDEFVNTVHDLWIEKNQKTSATAPITTPAPVSPMETEAAPIATPIKEEVTEVEEVEIKVEAPTPEVEEESEESSEEEVVTPIKVETKKPDFVKPEPKVETKTVEANPFTNSQPVKTVERNQERTERTDRPERNDRRDSQSNQSNQSNNNRNQDRQSQPRNNQDNSNNRNNQVVNQPTKDMNTNKQDDKAISLQDDTKSTIYKSFDIKKVRETATKLELDQVYKAYLDSKDSFANVEKTYFESQSALFDKLMTIVVNFEQVADYFESMTEKLLDMNEKIIMQGKELQAVKSSLVSKNQDLDDKAQILESDIQRVERDLRDTKSVNSRRYQELSEVASRINNDSFGDEVTIKSRMDLIDAKIAKLNNQINASSKIASLTSIATEVNGKKKSN